MEGLWKTTVTSTVLTSLLYSLRRSTQYGVFTTHNCSSLSVYLRNGSVATVIEQNTFKLRYNDIGLCDTPSITSYILRYQLIP